MALSRLRKVIEYYLIYQHVDDKKEVDVITTKNSLNIKRIYTSGGAVSMFFHENNCFRMMDEAFPNKVCQIEFGHRDDADHNSWHLSKDDFEEDHAHLMKHGRKLLSPQDFKCIFDRIKQFEEANKDDPYFQNVCPHAEGEGLISEEDQALFLKDYTDYYQDKRNIQKAVLYKQEVDQLYQAITDQCKEALKPFAFSFIKTMIENYAVPYLITQGYDRTKVKLAAESAIFSFQLPLVSSIFQMASDIIVRNALKPVLNVLFKTAGVDEVTSRKLSNHISNHAGIIAAFTNDPLSLASYAMNGTASMAGEEAAYRIIHSLPKLKQEPRAEANDGEYIVKPAKLRRRF